MRVDHIEVADVIVGGNKVPRGMSPHAVDRLPAAQRLAQAGAHMDLAPSALQGPRQCLHVRWRSLVDLDLESLRFRPLTLV